MKVLQVSDFFPPVRGGLESHVDDLATELTRRGHEVHVATMTRDAVATSPDVHVHPVTTLTSRLVRHAQADRPFHPPFPDPRAVRALRAIIERVRPDVVHAHSWLGVSVPSGLAPVVFTAHDYALVCQLHTLRTANGADCDGPRALACAACALHDRGVAKAAVLAAAVPAGRRRLSADLVLTLSDQVRRTIAPYVSVPVRTVGGFLAPAVEAPAPPLPAEPFVMYAGDPGPHKGLDLLLDLWAGRQAPPAPLVVATTKPISRPVPSAVHVMQLDRAGMRAAWRRAAIAVVPSLWREPFGMVAVEALTEGTPVVAFASGALTEIVRDGVDGVVVPRGDIAGLAGAVRNLLYDDARRLRMAEAGRLGASRFHPDVVLARIEQSYTDVVDRAAVPA